MKQRTSILEDMWEDMLEFYTRSTTTANIATIQNPLTRPNTSLFPLDADGLGPLLLPVPVLVLPPAPVLPPAVPLGLLPTPPLALVAALELVFVVAELTLGLAVTL
jgi:hypothetical protein